MPILFHKIDEFGILQKIYLNTIIGKLNPIERVTCHNKNISVGQEKLPI
jgi:hypothetical protein